MKKNIFNTLTVLFFIAATLFSCSGEEEIVNTENNEQEMRTLTVRLVPQTETRTMLDENAVLRWEEGDKVSYFSYTEGHPYTASKSATINIETGTFEAVLENTASKIFVLYPAVADGTSWSKDLYTVKKDQSGCKLSDILPMIASEDVPSDASNVDVKYSVNGAVVKVKLNGIPYSTTNTTRIRRIELGNYYRDFTDNTAEQTDTYYFVMPIKYNTNDPDINYTATVYTTDYAVSGTDYTFVTGHVYQRNTIMKAAFEPKAYNMTLDVSNKDKYNDICLTGTREGHDWVDLGILKSDYDNSVSARSENDFRMLFSTVNIGSTTPTASTLYFRWGEMSHGWRYANNTVKAEPYQAVFKSGITHTVNAYVESVNGTVVIYYGSDANGEDIQGTSKSYSTKDDKGSYYQIFYGDMASYYTGWSTGWCMMNKVQAEFLLSDKVKNISKSWTTENGASGYEFKNVITDASVFFPAAGHLNGDTYPKDKAHGYYWLSCTVENKQTSYLMDMTDSGISILPEERYIGCSVRPISMLRYTSTKLTNTANGLSDFEDAGSMF